MNPDIADSMDELRRRVARNRADGVYSANEVNTRMPGENAPAIVRDLEGAARLADVSSSPPAPPADTGVRAAAERVRASARDVVRRPADDVADRTTAFNTALIGYLRELADEVAALRAEIDRLSGGDTGRD